MHNSVFGKKNWRTVLTFHNGSGYLIGRVWAWLLFVWNFPLIFIGILMRFFAPLLILCFVYIRFPHICFESRSPMIIFLFFSCSFLFSNLTWIVKAVVWYWWDYSNGFIMIYTFNASDSFCTELIQRSRSKKNTPRNKSLQNFP